MIRNRNDGYTGQNFSGAVKEADFVVSLSPGGQDRGIDITEALSLLTGNNGLTSVGASSGNKADAAAAAALAATADELNYLSGFSVTGSGATTGLPVSVTVTGLAVGTLTFTYTFVADVVAPNEPLNVTFDPPLPASADNTAITVTCPASGSGGTNNTTNVWGYRAASGEVSLNYSQTKNNGLFMMLFI